MENLKAGKEQAMKAPAPLRVGLRAVPPSDISALDGIPGITYADSTATVTVDSLRVGYSVLLKMVGIATSGYRSRMFEIFDNKPNPKVMMSAFLERVGKTWFDYESGRWKASPARRAPREKPEAKLGWVWLEALLRPEWSRGSADSSRIGVGAASCDAISLSLPAVARTDRQSTTPN